jgi:Core-2/I-Branching enzyme
LLIQHVNKYEPIYEYSEAAQVMPDGISFYSPQDAELISSVNTVITVTGFQFCTELNGAQFDSLIQIKPLRGSVAEINPDISTFINIIDTRAFEIYRQLLRKNTKGDQMDVKRVSCYSAAEGNSAFANMTQSRLLTQIEPINYFKSVLPAILPQKSPLSGPRRKFKIAYLLMIHEINGFPHAANLLEMLDDGDAIILIHVDARPKSQPLFVKLQSWIHKREKTIKRQSNIYFAEHRFFNIWGHISLVFTQLSGFWELLDMADWDFMVNLSNYDYPIKSNAVIHKTLIDGGYKDKNWIEFWEDTGISV